VYWRREACPSAQGEGNMTKEIVSEVSLIEELMTIPTSFDRVVGLKSLQGVS
jgi:hypothetical protein